MDLKAPVKKLFMVGPIYARRLKKLGIETVGDLLHHFPFRYIDYSLISPIGKLQIGEIVSTRGRVISIKNEYTRYGKKIQKGIVADATGSIEVVWFNQPFLVKTIKVGEEYGFSGKVDWFGRKFVLVSPEYEVINREHPIHTGRLVPVYHETYGVSSKWLRSKISPLLSQVLPSISDLLPKEITRTNNLLDLASALRWIHFPENETQVKKARERFAFEELFLLQLVASKRKIGWRRKKTIFKLKINQEKLLEFINSLPFALTSAQKRCLKEILADLGKSHPMNRLLEGDVGSGKTVVAAGAIYVAYLNGVQSALMAPTEILANQHFKTLKLILEPLGVKIDLLTGSTTYNNIQHTTCLPRRQAGNTPDLIVGTHALIFKRAKFERLGLVIIDEQHRFGVEQRGELIRKGRAPHILTMTATPIPRTIALTLYGDLDLSLIDEMPPGRQQVKTWVVPPQKRQAAYQWIRKQVKNEGGQCFIICPLIEESETLQTIKAATAEYKRLREEVFLDLKLGLLHGKMKSKEKEKVISQFREGEIDILVSTPVVEVGIDIPQATIMMIEGADRFGLAQLHQLRGRVGRGMKESYCLLFSETPEGKPLQRLKALEKTYFGMKLAELDLKMRGPGEIYGTAQSGFFELKIASFSDLSLIQKTRKAAQNIAPRLTQYPLLQAKLKQDTIDTIEPN